MTRVKKTAILLAVMVITISLVFSGCVKKNPQADSETAVAVVGGEQIMKTEFNQMFEMFKVQYEQQYGTEIWEQDVDGRKYIDVMKEKVLDMLVDIKVQEQEALKSGITATEEEIEAEVEKARKYFDSEEKFNEFLTSQKMTMEYLRDTIRKDILVSKLQEKLTTEVSVTDDEVAAYYGANQDQFISIKASHILIEDEEEAKKMLERVKKGENFNELALEYSVDPTAKDNKGDLGYFRKGQMVEPFETAAFALKAGEISELVKTDYGYHIIKLEDKKYDKLEEIAAELKISMVDNKKDTVYQELIEEMRTKADIKKYPKNL
ncbi:MAG TPA: peptidylprolyl isomerase [Patescibacteria group bacterium]|nr:peptidylprolyl isomerase [Patescibacteria group bacterium]